MDLQKRFTRSAFTRWLALKTPRQVVGKPQESSNCPLANFLKTVLPEQEQSRAYVGLYTYGSREQFYELLPWAVEFRIKVDSLKVKNVTAKRALSLLGV
jgi:hypothetical protein